MAVNHKLTSVIRGRVVASIEYLDEHWMITFKDRSHMTIKSAGGQATLRPGTKIKGVRQNGAVFYIDIEDSSGCEITALEPTSCVTVQAANGKVEFQA